MNAPLVLIVEANAHVRCALVTVLRGAGYRTLEATSVDAARGVLDAVIPQVVLVDHGGPGQAGPELISWLRHAPCPRTQAVPVVGMSGPEPEGQALLAAGASRLLRKPFGPRALTDALVQLLPRYEVHPGAHTSP